MELIMPQPLSALLRKEDPWSIAINPDELAKYPHLASSVAKIIARASAIEHGAAMFLVHVLHISPEPAFAMFSEVMDGRNRQAMILAAARSALPNHDFEMLEAIMLVVRAQIDHRNKFAHWLWGTCEQIPDALLLVDPRYLLGHARHLQQMKIESSVVPERVEELIGAMSFDFDRIYVYRKADFESTIRDFRETMQIVDEFNFILNPDAWKFDEQLAAIKTPFGNQVEKARLRLSRQRLFAEALQRLRHKRQKTKSSVAEHEIHKIGK